MDPTSGIKTDSFQAYANERRSAVITGLDVLRAAVPLGPGRGGSGATSVDLFVVSITTDDGATGSGFTYSISGAGEGVDALLRQTVTDTVVGTRLAAWPRTASALWNCGQRIARGFLLAAISSVDIAVHDLLARRADQPLFEFLGAHSDHVPVYGSGRSTHAMTVDELVDGSMQYVAEGYRAIKLRVGAKPAEEDVQRVRAVRAAVGDEVRIMVDANERLDLPTAMWLSRQLDGLGIYWFEEPLRSDDLAGHARLAAMGLPIAVGEHLHGRHEFAHYLQRNAASVLMPDVPLAGGVSEWLRISAIAEAFGAVVTPHFLPELHIHLAAAVSNCPYIEHFPLIDDMLLETLDICDGVAQVPLRPGHGMLWNHDALDRCRVA